MKFKKLEKKCQVLESENKQLKTKLNDALKKIELFESQTEKEVIEER